MDQRWIMITNHYEDLEKRAIHFLYAAISDHLNYVLPIKDSQSITDQELEGCNLIFVGKWGEDAFIAECEKQDLIQTPRQKEGYSIYIGNSIYNKENQMIIVSGYDASGVLYGCMDFCNKYLGDILYKDKNIWTDETFDHPFDSKLNFWHINTYPAIKRRAIWTWGHVIYDYRNFFHNMARLRLNEVVIWNDVAPLNAKDVVDYAHSLNIKVIWGFALGWDTSCKTVLERYNAQFAAEIKNQVLDTYEKEYHETGADGIYFQTFTEHSIASVNGTSIAQIVTELVNDVAASLFDKYPTINIQFGLHATSVREQLDYIKKVDERMQIVWEDCGSFPYEYYADRVENFEETLSFTEKALNLRGKDEKWGAVLKGMLKLDWRKFEHFSAPYILGERTASFIKNRQINKDRIWKLQQAGWLKNAEYLRKTVAAVEKYGNNDSVIQALVEDAMLENQIIFPVALYAETLWSPDRDSLEMTEQVSKYPCVNYANI